MLEPGLIERYFYESFANLDEALAAVLDSIAVEIEDAGPGRRRGGRGSRRRPSERVRASVLAFVTSCRTTRARAASRSSRQAPCPDYVTVVRRCCGTSRTARPRTRWRSIGLRPPSGSDGEIGGLLFIGGIAELITAWLDGALDATPDEMVDAATRMYLGLYA